MKAYEVPAKVSPEGKLEISPGLADVLKPGQVVKLIVLVGEPEDEDAAWNRLGLEQFFAGYGDVDSIYDKED